MKLLLNCEDCGIDLGRVNSNKKYCKDCVMRRAVASRQNMRARKLGIEGTFTANEWVSLCKEYDNRCLRCGSTVLLTPDHIVPLTYEGTNYISNIQPLCISCNFSKNVATISYRNESLEEKVKRWNYLTVVAMCLLHPLSEDIVLIWQNRSGQRDIRVWVFEDHFKVQVTGYPDKRVDEIIPLPDEEVAQYAFANVIATVGNVGLTAERRDKLLSMQEKIRQVEEDSAA